MGISLVRASSIMTELMRKYVDSGLNKKLNSSTFESGTWVPKVITPYTKSPTKIIDLTSACDPTGYYKKLKNVCMFTASVIFTTAWTAEFGDYFLSLPFTIQSNMYGRAGQFTWQKNNEEAKSGIVKTKSSDYSDKLMLSSHNFTVNDNLIISGWFYTT